MEEVVRILSAFVSIYTLCLFAWVLISWFPMFSPKLAYDSRVLAVRKFLDSVVMPWVRLFRFVPPVRIGGAMLDLSAMVAIFVFIIGSGLVINILADLAVS